ncbi:hypothetical protein ACJMK2_021788 [Sinanodonta woodiana]|uniref:Uncharacterized protein n=1 Tax=Sinanodonta woodiana TaxID=1069815 RepID=A0ABD3TI32_SINWO
MILNIVCHMDQTYQGRMEDRRQVKGQSTVKGFTHSHIIIPKKVTTEPSILTSIKNIDVGNEVRHVAFIKVYKAASSTAQNVFLRFGWARNLTFVLSSTRSKFGYSNVISSTESLTKSNILPKPNGKHFDIQCSHIIYNKSAFEYFLPNDTIYIGIVREPYEQYKSTLHYYRPRYIFKNIKGDFPASIYIRDPLKYEPRSIFKYKFNSSEVRLILETLASEFKLVIISEQMEESIVLMRRYLHWNMKDIVFLDQNVAFNKKDNRLVRPHDRHLYRQWAKLDYALYDFFLRRLRAQIRDQGPDFDDELILLKEVRKDTSIFCLNDPKEDEFIPINESKWRGPFNITWEDCKLFRMGERLFQQIIRERQYGPMHI